MSCGEAVVRTEMHNRKENGQLRGGLSSSLNELADASDVGVKLDEPAIPLRPEVHAACAMLGLDPLYVANEGKLVAVVPPRDAEALLDVMRGHAPLTAER